MVPGFFRVGSARAWYTPAKTGGGFSALQKGVYFLMCDQTKVLAVYREFKTEFFSGGSPDWFGGCWLEGDKLVVGVCGEGAPLDWLELRLAEVREADRPESDLQALMEKVTDRLKEPELSMGVTAVWIDPRKNRLKAVLADPLDKAVPWFREWISDSDAILFEQDSFSPHADYHSGEVCGCNIAPVGSHYGAIGYPAVDGAGQQGFVTAAHVVHGCLPDIYVHQTPGTPGPFVKIGVVAQEDNVPLDAAFVTLDAGFGVRRTCPVYPTDPMVSLPDDTDLPVGTVLEQYSRHNSSQMVESEIIASSATQGGRTDVYILMPRPNSPLPASGDSGSPVMTAGNHELVGIYRGTFTVSNRISVVKEKNIRAAFGVSLNAAAPV